MAKTASVSISTGKLIKYAIWLLIATKLPADQVLSIIPAEYRDITIGAVLLAILNYAKHAFPGVKLLQKIG